MSEEISEIVVGKWEPPADIAPWMVCAANRIRGTDLIFCGARHFDDVMRRQIEAAGMVDRSHEMEQGFIDQWGRFYERAEALECVRRSGQPFNLKNNGGAGDWLFSEGLY